MWKCKSSKITLQMLFLAISEAMFGPPAIQSMGTLDVIDFQYFPFYSICPPFCYGPTFVLKCTQSDSYHTFLSAASLASGVTVNSSEKSAPGHFLRVASWFFEKPCRHSQSKLVYFVKFLRLENMSYLYVVRVDESLGIA